MGATVTTTTVTNIEQTGASLSASYTEASSEPTEVGFRYGTSSSSLTETITCNNYIGTASSFSADVVGLSAGTTYYVQSYVVVDGQTFSGSVTSFKTASAQEPAVSGKSWLELPGEVGGSDYVVNTYYDGSNRNYTHLYDKSMMTSLWTAYPLNSTHMGSLSRPGSWYYSPSIDETYQADLTDHSYSGEVYSRGHMIPNGSRNGNSVMQKQTFYVTNSVPQRQNKFNGTIWNALENALQSIANSEEIYVVTGVVFSKVGESKAIEYITPKDNTSQQCPIPNYFYKVVLKVNKSGDTVTSASTIGFWFEHKDYDNSTYVNYAVSVDQIETWTGFDFFVNLPDDVETDAEANISWTEFQNF